MICLLVFYSDTSLHLEEYDFFFGDLLVSLQLAICCELANAFCPSFKGHLHDSSDSPNNFKYSAIVGSIFPAAHIDKFCAKLNQKIGNRKYLDAIMVAMVMISIVNFSGFYGLVQRPIRNQIFKRHVCLCRPMRLYTGHFTCV